MYTIAMFMMACRSASEGEVAAGEPLDQYLIAYNVLVDDSTDNYDVLTLDPLTREQRNITNHPDVAWTYLADGERIFFISDRDTCRRCYQLFEMDAMGSNVRKISEILLKDSWMGVRNGKELVVNYRQPGPPGFTIIDLRGGILASILPDLPFASDPAFSPDGTYLAFRGGSAPSKRDSAFNEAIYRVNVDGSGLQRLSQYPPSDTTAPWHAYQAGPPRFHPTEDFISFQSFRDGKYSLFGVATDGSREWKLTDLEMAEGWHAWSPDGRWLAIEVFDPAQTQFHIALMDWPDKSHEILTDTTFRLQQAPVFVRRAGGK